MTENYTESTIEMSIAQYNVFVNRALKYDLLKKAVAGAIGKFETSNSLFVDNDLVNLFKILCPVEYENRIRELNGGEEE